MIIKHKIINDTLSYPLEKSSTLEDSSTIGDISTLEDIAFFDIETTGFSADSSYLYLIGCMHHIDNSWHLTQWLAEDINDEKDIILSFTKTLSTKKKIIHFNGSTFDIPYLNRKCKALGLINPFLGKKSYDIYKEVFPLKKLLPIPNFKLKTLESFVGVKREDTYSGGDLIQVYTSYIGKLQIEKLRALNTTKLLAGDDKDVVKLSNEGTLPSKELENILLLHNEEDIKSLIPISTLLFINDLFAKPIQKSFKIKYSIETLDFITTFCIHLSLPYQLPFQMSWEYTLGQLLNGSESNPFASSLLKINIMYSQIKLIIPMFTGTLKYFYKDYKDYYYLPVEDTAIHKSVAEYVDKEYRSKATKANCYTKKHGTFLPSVLPSYSKNNHKDKNNYPENSFFFDYEDKLYFTEYTDGLFDDLDNLEHYIMNVLNLFMNNKEITTMKID